MEYLEVINDVQLSISFIEKNDGQMVYYYDPKVFGLQQFYYIPEASKLKKMIKELIRLANMGDEWIARENEKNEMAHRQYWKEIDGRKYTRYTR